MKRKMDNGGKEKGENERQGLREKGGREEEK